MVLKPRQILRIVDFASGNLATGGTEITGSFSLNSAEMNIYENLLALNAICEVNTKNLRAIFSALSKNPIFGVSTGRRSITIFTSDDNVTNVINVEYKAGS